jgi:hypothetical protein
VRETGTPRAKANRKERPQRANRSQSMHRTPRPD